MKKLITILLIISVLASFTMSIGCFAEEKTSPTKNLQNLLLINDDSTCGFACKTKNYMSNVWEAIKGIPGTITATIVTVGTAAVFFRNIYKVYTSEILKLHNEIAKLEGERDGLFGEKNELPNGVDELKNRISELLSENEKLSNENKNLLNTFKNKFNLFNSFSGSFFTNSTQRLDTLRSELYRLGETFTKIQAKLKNSQTQKEELEEELKKLRDKLTSKEEEAQNEPASEEGDNQYDSNSFDDEKCQQQQIFKISQENQLTQLIAKNEELEMQIEAKDKELKELKENPPFPNNEDKDQLTEYQTQIAELREQLAAEEAKFQEQLEKERAESQKQLEQQKKVYEKQFADLKEIYNQRINDFEQRFLKQ